MEPIFKQPEHLESISVENMDLNKSFAFFDIDAPSFSDLSFGNLEKFPPLVLLMSN